MLRILMVLVLMSFALACGGAPEVAEEAEVAPVEETTTSAEPTFVGWIADQKCANEGKAAADGHAGCAQGCITGGESAVLVTEADGKIYQLSDQEAAKPHAGHKVTVAGTLEGDTIAVNSITM